MKNIQITDISFGGRLRSFRKSKGYNGTEFAQFMGVSQASLSAIENDKTSTSVQSVTNLVQNTDINIDWLLTGRGQKCVPPDVLQKTDTDGGVVLKHMSLVSNFSDKDSAVSINEKLLELEKLNPDAFRKIDGYLSGLIDGIKMNQADSASGEAPTEKARKKRTNGQ